MRWSEAKTRGAKENRDLTKSSFEWTFSISLLFPLLYKNVRNRTWNNASFPLYLLWFSLQLPGKRILFSFLLLFIFSSNIFLSLSLVILLITLECIAHTILTCFLHLSVFLLSYSTPRVPLGTFATKSVIWYSFPPFSWGSSFRFPLRSTLFFLLRWIWIIYSSSTSCYLLFIHFYYPHSILSFIRFSPSSWFCDTRNRESDTLWQAKKRSWFTW